LGEALWGRLTLLFLNVNHAQRSALAVFAKQRAGRLLCSLFPALLRRCSTLFSPLFRRCSMAPTISP
jgi:hypothetical protein